MSLEAPSVHPGEVLDRRYRVERVLGRGGMGTVLLATHLDLDEPRAIKLMHSDRAREPKAAERFVREAKAASRISSRYVAKVFDLGKLTDGMPFIVLEYLPGHDWKAELDRRGVLSVGDALGVILQVLRGLGVAHGLGIVHRDLKPSNLFLVSSDASRGGLDRSLTKIVDFGVAKLKSATATGEVTTDSDVIGSPLYMAPEQIRSTRHVDERADLWSVGAILYRFLTGKHAFERPTVADIMVAALTEMPVSPELVKPHIPTELAAAVLACLSKSPEDRPRSATALEALLLGAVDDDIAAYALRFVSELERELPAMSSREPERVPSDPAWHDSERTVTSPAMKAESTLTLASNTANAGPAVEHGRVRRWPLALGLVVLAGGSVALSPLGLRVSGTRPSGEITMGRAVISTQSPPTPMPIATATATATPNPTEAATATEAATLTPTPTLTPSSSAPSASAARASTARLPAARPTPTASVPAANTTSSASPNGNSDDPTRIRK
ncbi:MAG: serine/threonine-protein kinase [Polyangiaceae bacterium]